MMHEINYYGKPGSRNVIIQPVDDHDLEEMAVEMKMLTELAHADDWCIISVKINDWFSELTPWEAAPAFGKKSFGDGARQTLNDIVNEVIPAYEREYPIMSNIDDAVSSEISGDVTVYKKSGHASLPANQQINRKYILAGYSLAGFFALWASYQTDLFSDIAAVSPSVWYPGWIDYAKKHQTRAERIYLSLGDREEKTRNAMMSQVGDAIRGQYQLLQRDNIPSTLEWNPGNHFRDNGLRMAKGIAWCL